MADLDVERTPPCELLLAQRHLRHVTPAGRVRHGCKVHDLGI